MPPREPVDDDFGGPYAGGQDADETELDAAEGADEELRQADEPEGGDDQGGEVDDAEGDGLETDEPVRPRKRAPGADPAEIERRVAAETEARILREQINRPHQPTQAEMEAAQQRRQAALELMTADQRAEFIMNERQQVIDQRLNQTQFQTLDALDKVEFRSIVGVDKRLQALVPEVERRLGELRARGNNVSREIMLTQILGERARKALNKNTDNLRAKAAKARDRERSNGAAPVTARPGDRARRGGDERTERRRRLENVIL